MKSLLWLFPFCFLSFQANAEWFVHSYKNCFEKDADKFLVQKKNIHKVNEGGGVTYWRATKANEVSTLVYKYNLSSIVKSAKIYGRVTTWGDKSIGGLFVSKDGQKWIPLKTFKNSANSEKFRKETIWSWVPVEALGGHSLFVRVTFAPPPSPLHVQFARASPDLPSNTDAYRIVIQTNGPALPEAPLPPNWKPIILGEPKPLMWIRHGKHLRKVFTT